MLKNLAVSLGEGVICLNINFYCGNWVDEVVIYLADDVSCIYYKADRSV